MSVVFAFVNIVGLCCFCAHSWQNCRTE